MTYAPHSKDNSNPQHQQQTTKATTQTFSDSRESTSASLPLQAMMANSPQQQKLKSAAQLTVSSPVLQNLNSAAQSFANKSEPMQRIDDEEPLQGKFETESEPAQLEAASEAPRPNNTGLPDNLKSGIENLSGMSMDHVRVHYNSDKPAQLQAHAYAQGGEIHVAPGQEKHLPHEAWHVVQQAQGRVKPTMQMKGDVQINDDVGLEAEADLMGGRAMNNLYGKGSVSSINLVYSQTATQLFKVPEDLTQIKDDVSEIEGRIKDNNEDGELPGGNTWADETRSAVLRKLNEWHAYELAYNNADVGDDLPVFGEDVVTEPDVGVQHPNGKWTNVVENKYVSGGRSRITENVKDAIGQIKCSNRSAKYYGDLFARIHLSDNTREDLRENGTSGGDTKMINAWKNYMNACANRILMKSTVKLIVMNLPDRFNGEGYDFEWEINVN